MPETRRIAIVGYGKMGRLIEQLAPEYGFETALKLDEFNNSRLRGADGGELPRDRRGHRLFDSRGGGAQRRANRRPRRQPGDRNHRLAGAHGSGAEPRWRRHGTGAVWSPNYSVGVNAFFRLVAEAARLLAAQPEYGAWAWEIHHSAKKDAPSGTLLKLVEEMRKAGYARAIDVSSNRAGAHPGTHEIGFDSAADSITLRHTARSREGLRPRRAEGRAVGGGQAGVSRVRGDCVWVTVATCANRPSDASGGRQSARSALLRRWHMFTGCGTALVTPFRRDLSLDEETLRSLVRRQIEAGIDFLVPCGTTGESPTLTRAEHLRVVEIAVEEAEGKVPVLAGAGGYNTREVIELALESGALGADGILSVTPYYNKPSQEGLFQHYRAIAAEVRLPIVVYSVQGRTGVNIEPATMARLAAIPNIVGVKEASGNLGQMANIVHEVPPDFKVLSGDDAVTIPLMALGGRGIVSVVSNQIPAQMTRSGASLPARRFRRGARRSRPATCR